MHLIKYLRVFVSRLSEYHYSNTKMCPILKSNLVSELRLGTLRESEAWH